MSLMNHINYKNAIRDNLSESVLIVSTEDYVTEVKLADDNNKGGIEIHIYHNEGTEPHFHVKSKGDNFDETCLRIGEPGYFHHGDYTGTLKRKVLKQVDSILRKPHKSIPGCTNYDVVIAEWKRGNYDWRTLKNSHLLNNPQPDYEKINKSDE